MGIHIKKFQASTLQKAIEKVREELGDNAIILQTDPIRTSGALKMFGKNAVEVTAAIDRADAPAAAATLPTKPQSKFHATVGESTPSSDNQTKSQWWGLLSKKTKRPSAPGASISSAAQTPSTYSKPAGAVVAPAAAPSDASALSPSVGQMYAMKTFIEPLKKDLDSLKAKLSAQEPVAPRKRVRDPLELEVQQLRQDLQSFLMEKRYEDTKLPFYYRSLMKFWSEKGMSNKQIFGFFKQIEKWGHTFSETSSDKEVATSLRSVLQESISEANVFQKKEQRVVIVVGPTGVGKTTTIAKLAAYEKLRLKRSVSFITVDDFKIGATDQLAHYARILEIPFSKSRPDFTLENQCVVQATDTIFVDTFGVSPRDIERLNLLKKMLKFQDPLVQAKLEVHLALPVGVAPQDVEEYLASFSELNPKYLLFTKWDETMNWGGMLSTILASRKPVSFVCHGQNVPDDMALFSKNDFIRAITSFSNSEES